MHRDCYRKISINKIIRILHQPILCQSTSNRICIQTAKIYQTQMLFTSFSYFLQSFKLGVMRSLLASYYAIFDHILTMPPLYLLLLLHLSSSLQVSPKLFRFNFATFMRYNSRIDFGRSRNNSRWSSKSYAGCGRRRWRRRERGLSRTANARAARTNSTKPWSRRRRRKDASSPMLHRGERLGVEFWSLASISCPN